MIKYYRLGADKQLNEIVMVGSHDAGIVGDEISAVREFLDQTLLVAAEA